MNILELIDKRNNINIGKNVKDLMLEEAAKCDKDIITFIIRENGFNDNNRKDFDNILSIKKRYQLKGMFELGDVLPDSGSKFVLYVYTKEKPVSFTIGVYLDKVLKTHRHYKEKIEWKRIYSLSYYRYLQTIEKWMEFGLTEDTDYYSFNTIDISELSEEILIPKRYTKRVLKINKIIKNEKTIVLEEVADIIRPMPIRESDNKVGYFTIDRWKYPIDISDLKEGVMTDTPIQKNDILFVNFSRIFLVDAEINEEIHINPNYYIIRPKYISPYYLFLYLQSETAQTILQSLAMGEAMNRVRKADMNRLPIIKPFQNSQEYYYRFRLKFYKPQDISDFNRFDRIITYYDKFKERGVEEKVEDILEDELVQGIRLCKKEIMSEFLDADIKELNTCFRGKAYKATLIMAGSIMEAILIDWLSEIKGVNYFDENETYIVKKPKRDKNNNVMKDGQGDTIYYEKKADLIDYINEIHNLAKPEWMKADEAHEIRKKRNLVHAKLCMSESIDINEQTCRKVIQYLKEIIETRKL